MMTPWIFFSSYLVLMGLSLSFGASLISLGTSHLFLFEVEVWQMSGLDLKWSLLFDLYSVIFFFCVLLISFSVLLFSYDYMRFSLSNSKFHLIILVFITSMVFLIFSPNLISLILGWDGLGISSFFLVIFYQSAKANSAGLLTALSNRVGDSLVLMSMFLVFSQSSASISIFTLQSVNPPLIILLALMGAAFTKSAQLPFSAWLPAAMAAPTPVSSLVHSSTLVTAGVYLIFRLSPYLDNLLVVTFLCGSGALTMTMASVSAFFESDMKKIVALSTLSQLGVMISACGLQNFYLVFFHLISHAFFKALMFISVGAIIHNSNQFQDLRRSGGQSVSLMICKSVIVLSKLSLCGLPFFSAFYSKEMIIELLSSGQAIALPLYTLLWLGIAGTVIYTLRFCFYVFLKSSSNLPLLAQQDWNLLVMSAQVTLWLPSMAGGKFIFYSILEDLTLPVTSSSAKIGGYLMLLSLPLGVFLFWNFFVPLSWVRNLGGLWLIPDWSGVGPLRVLGTSANFFSWQSSFGGLDSVYFSWLMKIFYSTLWKKKVSNPSALKMTFSLLVVFSLLLWVYLCILSSL